MEKTWFEKYIAQVLTLIVLLIGGLMGYAKLSGDVETLQKQRLETKEEFSKSIDKLGDKIDALQTQLIILIKEVKKY